jgi:uncharacterized membrane protein YeiH
MTFINLIEIAGTSVFAISGSLVGIKHRLDLFGVFVLALITASGGGLIRDVIIHHGMPVFFTNSSYLITITVSFIITCATFLSGKFLRVDKLNENLTRQFAKFQFVITIFDAAGLGLFTVLTAFTCINLDYPLIGVLFIACLTGIGGGVLRDIMVNEVPLVFRSEIYALAALSGALLLYVLNGKIDSGLSIYISAFFVFAVRIISVIFKLNIPSLKVLE